MHAPTHHPSGLITLIILLPLLGALINGLFGKRMSQRSVIFFGVASVGAAFVLSLIAVFQVAALPEGDILVVDLWRWFSADQLTIELSFMLDRLNAVMLLVVTGVGSLIHVFSIGYMRDDASFSRYFAYLNLFMFSMLLLILGKNLLVLFIGWEGVGLCSYLLIGFWFNDMQKAEAGQKAFITNRVGDLAFLIGTFILLFYSHGSLDFVGASELGGGLTTTAHEMVALGDGGQTMLTVVCVLFFIGACGKSAQIPLYVWLPDAMAGPTPVSALIHAATMVTAGVYMMARLNPMFALSETAMLIVAIVGALTALMAATIALVQTDIKKVLAYSTVSQIGFMVLAIGVGGFVGAIFHLMTHAFFKACLFLGSGSVIHAMHHEQDIRKMGGLKKKLPVTRWTFLISCLAIAGVPFFAGFFSKDEILFFAATAHRSGSDPMMAIYIIAMAAAGCTAFYMFRLYFLTFEGTYRGDKHTWDHAHEETVMNIPLAVLGFLAAVGGFLGLPHFMHAHALDAWLKPIFGWIYEGPDAIYHYPHGEVGLEIGLMALSVAVAGIGIFVAYRLYMSATTLPAAPVDTWWHKLLINKYYVDEFYDAVFIRPMRATARFLHQVTDVGIIDRIFVRGTAGFVKAIGAALARLQNGDVQAYAAAIVVGLALIIVAIEVL